ncbi:MAG: DUF5723 family protein [Candidatus Latescibacterota bacterium]|nr:DUF5723 family protein [Candidatus Latescibacterota bacterium]
MRAITHIMLLTIICFSGRVYSIGYGDMQPAAASMAQAYGAMARGAESIYWNPANLALKGGPNVSIRSLFDFSFSLENNSISIEDYNKYNGTFIDVEDKEAILADIGPGGLRFNTDVGIGVPIIGGFSFPLPGNFKGAFAVDLQVGGEGAIPRDMIDFLLYGNQFGYEREAVGKAPGYDIAKWDGDVSALAVLSFALAKQWMPSLLQPYLSQFAVGGTFKVIGGGIGEVLRSNGGIETKVNGTNVDAYGITRMGGGQGFGLDLGVTGVSADGRATVSLAFMNLLDTMTWDAEFDVGDFTFESRTDSFYVEADRLRALSFAGQNSFGEIFDNPLDENGDTVFREKTGTSAFSTNLPAMLRLGGTYDVFHNLRVNGQYDQAFSSGFGISSTPRVALGAEYSIVKWFPMRVGLSAGGRVGNSSAFGLGIGPFSLGSMKLRLLEFATVNRGGFLPAGTQGMAISLGLFRFEVGGL